MNYKIIDRVQADKLKVGDVFVKSDSSHVLRVVELIDEYLFYRMYAIDRSYSIGGGSAQVRAMEPVFLTNLKLVFVERE